MAEFEGSRVLAAGAQDVFAVASDLERLPAWLPTATSASSAGPDRVHVEGEAGGHPYADEGFWRPRPEQLRVEWGAQSDADGAGYAGWLQVADSEAGDGGTASEVTVHLSFAGSGPDSHGADPATTAVSGIDDALAALEQEVLRGAG